MTRYGSTVEVELAMSQWRFPPIADTRLPLGDYTHQISMTTTARPTPQTKHQYCYRNPSDRALLSA